MITANDNAVMTAPFDVQEYAERQARVRDRARELGFDALLIADPANLYYLTGYNAWSFYTAQLLYLPVEGAPTLIMRLMDANGAWRTAAGIASENILGYPETLVHRPDVHPGDWMAQQLAERGAGGAQRVGYEGEAHFFAVRTFRSIQQALPHWDLVDCNDIVNWVRLVKSPAEIEYMRAAGRVSTNAMRTGFEALTAGRPTNEVAAAILAAQAYGVPSVNGSPAVDGDYPAIVPMLPTGAGADTPHLTWNASPTPVNEAITLEIAGVHRRYHAPLARTAVIGKPTPGLERLANVTTEALDAALDTVRAGVTAHDVAEAFRLVISAAGYEKASRLGYSIGIGYPPDWGERTVSIRSGDDTVLEPNMTFHLIAGMWMTGFGFETSESIRVTESGVELFADLPRNLTVLDDRSHL